MVLRVTLDSNVYISAFRFGGKPLQIIEMARRCLITLCITQLIVTEIAGVLTQKFGWPGERVEDVMAELLAIAVLVEPRERIDAVHADPDDNKILECAVASKSTYLVTGDKHLLSLGPSFGGIEIFTPAQFLDREL